MAAVAVAAAAAAVVAAAVVVMVVLFKITYLQALFSKIVFVFIYSNSMII